MTSGDLTPDLPTLEPGDVVWRPGTFWRFTGPIELWSGDTMLAEAEWLDADPPEWRVDAGRRELGFRVAQWKPMRIEVVVFPGGGLEMVHQGSKPRPRQAIVMGEARYYLVKSGFGQLSYLTETGSVIATVRTKMNWHGGTTVTVRDMECSAWHLWTLVCYAGFRFALTYRHMFKSDTSAGLHSLIGRASDYDFAL